jgi:hypothetical protein
MEEISTSFICLLHLVNEWGLKLELTMDGLPQVEDIVEDEDEEDNVSSTEKKVRNIWNLKVCFASTVGCEYC